MEHPRDAGDPIDAIDDLPRLLAGLGITGDDSAQLRAALTLRRLEKRDRLLDPDELRAMEGIVTKGCLRVYFTESDGSERVLYFAPEGWWITDVDSFLTEGSQVLGIEALEPTDIWVLDKAGHPPALTDRSTDRVGRVLAASALAAVQKRLIGGMRKTAAQRYGEFRCLYPGLDLRIPQYHIAAYLGISPEFLSKLRKQLLRARS